MQRVDYNKPDTRARVEALRRMRKTRDEGQTTAGRSRRTVVRLNQALARPILKMRSRNLRAKSLLSSARQPAAARQRERRKAQVQPGMRRKLSHWLATGQLASLVIFLGSVGVLVVLFTSPQFSIKRVSIEGNELVGNAYITDLSTLLHQSIWFIDEQSIVQRLLENPYIERASVRVTLPDHATIHIVERQPDVRWQVGAQDYLVDSDGRVLEPAATVPESTTLIIVDTSTKLLKPNDHVDPDAVRLAHSLAARLPAELHMTPALIGWDFGLGVYIRTPGQQTIVFGQSENLDEKLAILGEMLKNGMAFTYLDLRSSNPFYQNTPPPSAQPPDESARAGTEG